MGQNKHGVSPKKVRGRTPKTKKRMAAKKAMLASRKSNKRS